MTDDEVIEFGYRVCSYVSGIPVSSDSSRTASAAFDTFGPNDPTNFDFEDFIVIADSSIFYLCPDEYRPGGG